jgi:hypothetical protein
VAVTAADDQDAYGWLNLGIPRNNPCVQCGACCQTTTLLLGQVVRVRCEHLVVTGTIGTPYATSCAVQHARRDGDPITMRTIASGLALLGARCGERPCVRAATGRGE